MHIWSYFYSTAAVLYLRWNHLKWPLEWKLLLWAESFLCYLLFLNFLITKHLAIWRVEKKRSKQASIHYKQKKNHSFRFVTNLVRPLGEVCHQSTYSSSLLGASCHTYPETQRRWRLRTACGRWWRDIYLVLPRAWKDQFPRLNKSESSWYQFYHLVRYNESENQQINK